MTLVIYRSRFAVPREDLFEFHSRVSNLMRISPPFPRLQVENAIEPTHEGDLQRIVLRAGPFRQEWEARVRAVVPGLLIEDIQERGPFRNWRHQHRFEDAGIGESTLVDVVAFRVLPTKAGEFVEYLLVRPAIWLMLAWRHRRTRALVGR